MKTMWLVSNVAEPAYKRALLRCLLRKTSEKHGSRLLFYDYDEKEPNIKTSLKNLFQSDPPDAIFVSNKEEPVLRGFDLPD